MRFCPHCGGDLTQYLEAEGPSASRVAALPQKKYDQVSIWKGLIAQAHGCAATPPEPISLIAPPPTDGGPFNSIIHIVFDRNVVPSGGVMMRALKSDGAASLSSEQLKAMGYSMIDGKIQLVDDIPVGKAYNLLDYWGGQRQHKRWHLAEPVTINPSRNGDPYFMDDNMVAFGAKWRDCAKYNDAMAELLNLFVSGPRGESESTGIPLAMHVHWAQP